MKKPQRLHLLHHWKESSCQKLLKNLRQLNSTTCWFFGGGARTLPTFIIVHLIPVSVDHVRLQEVQKGACDKEAVGEWKVFDIAHVQGKGIGWRRDGAQAHQLTDDVPHTNT